MITACPPYPLLDVWDTPPGFEFRIWAGHGSYDTKTAWKMSLKSPKRVAILRRLVVPKAENSVWCYGWRAILFRTFLSAFFTFY